MKAAIIVVVLILILAFLFGSTYEIGRAHV